MVHRPDIVLIVIDDLGWRDLACMGSTFYETPHIDRLASSGARFTQAYAPSPVCSPSRAAILTGRDPARIGLTQFIGGHGVGRLGEVPTLPALPANEVTLARTLREAGYATWHVGKWHLGPRHSWPDQHGFDVNVGGCERGRPGSYHSPYGIDTLPDGREGEYLTDRLTDEAIDLIRTAGDRPYFLNLWHYAVHTPIQGPAELVEKYERKRSLLDDQPEFETGEPYPVWHRRHHLVRRRVTQSDPGYAAMIENLDANVGRLLDAISESGRADRTLIVLTSDNGGLSSTDVAPTCNLPLREGKGWTYDGGVRVPLLVRWPGVTRAGAVIDAPVSLVDLFPTLNSATDATLPPVGIDGVDVAPMLRGEEQDRGPIYWHYPHYSHSGATPATAVRAGRWKLVRHYETDRDELYRMADDESESSDVAAEHPRRAAELGRLLDDYLSEIGAGVPAPNPIPPFADLPG
ncbi:sulfatase [Ruania alkalisoli]|uniref:Sulfatase n=1 Tax=Ruania alkalisoli TaxID=2779775 RepID=A0A7M1SVC3_9MICO|nr:sulfatase [Ruania alkalisoli]QOR71431.1 sulfatase [Ruania alkalisoli]